MLGGFNEVIPPGGSDILQLWSAAPLLGAVIEGLAGIRPDAGAHRVELAPRAPTDLDFYSLEGVTVGGHELSLAFRQGAGERIVQVAHTAGDVPLLCVFRAVVEPGEVVLLNGAEVDVTPTASLTLGREEVALEFTLEPQEGARIVVGRLASGRP